MMTALPEAITRAWEADTQAKLGGLMQMAGIDVAEAFSTKRVVDHPWLGLTIRFPFPEVGEGRIVDCMTHPLGQLMFDVDFPSPVPPIHGGSNPYVALKDRPEYHETSHRFFASELLSLGVEVV